MKEKKLTFQKLLKDDTDCVIITNKYKNDSILAIKNITYSLTIKKDHIEFKSDKDKYPNFFTYFYKF